jgi:hypothetical protein
MLLYHQTTAANAAQILRDGFRDGEGYYHTDRLWRGVWLSNMPLEGGAEGDILLKVELPEQIIADYEWITEGQPYREWLIPAELVNAHFHCRC